MNDAFGGAKLEVRAATDATYGNLPKVTLDIPPLVCPPEGLPPIGVDRGGNQWSPFITTALLVALFTLVSRAGRHVIQLDLLLIGGWLAATALHEAGHAIAARARGFAIISIFVGPLYITRAPRGGVRIGARGSVLGGAVLATPRRWEGAERFRRDFFWFVMAGPATSLAIGAIGLLASHPRGTIWFCSIISVVIGVMTLIPTRYATGRTTDGEKLRRLRHPEPIDAPLTALRCMANLVAPRDWDSALVAIAITESESQGSEAIDTTSLLYHRAVDAGDIHLARELMQRLIDYVCGTARWPRTTISIEVGLEAALFEAAWRGDDAAAQAWLARAPSKRKAMTVAKLSRLLWRGGHASAWLCHRATLERLASNSSSS